MARSELRSPRRSARDRTADQRRDGELVEQRLLRGDLRAVPSPSPARSSAPQKTAASSKAHRRRARRATASDRLVGESHAPARGRRRRARSSFRRAERLAERRSGRRAPRRTARDREDARRARPSCICRPQKSARNSRAEEHAGGEARPERAVGVEDRLAPEHAPEQARAHAATSERAPICERRRNAPERHLDRDLVQPPRAAEHDERRRRREDRARFSSAQESPRRRLAARARRSRARQSSAACAAEAAR